MGLNWLQRVRKHIAKPQQIETSANPPSGLQRLLFIGYGKIPGFDNFQWEDWNWKNAADFEAVFINLGSLYKLLFTWQNQLASDPDNFPEEPFERLRRNLAILKGQILQI